MALVPQASLQTRGAQAGAALTMSDQDGQLRGRRGHDGKGGGLQGEGGQWGQGGRDAIFNGVGVVQDVFVVL